MARGPRSRRTWLVVIVVGLTLLVTGAVAWWFADRDPAPVSFGGDDARALASASTSASPTTTTSLPPTTTTTPSPAPPPPAAAEPGDGPIRELSLPDQGVRAAVVPVGVAADGTMEIPEDVRTAGWYRFGPAPGDASGSVVISGHINDRDQGVGAFATLADVTEGEPVIVTMADGRALEYKVVARERFDKHVVPMDRIFDRGGAARLTLVTCGGAFDRSTRNYQDNIVVTAVPTGSG